MGSPYSEYGYQRLRELAHGTFPYLALVDDQGNEVTRIDVRSDERVQQTPDPSSNPLTYVVDVHGYDNDIDNPVTIVETALYEEETDGTPVGTDSMKPARVEADGDKVTVSHEQQLPPQ